MSDFDTNYEFKLCPNCGVRISTNKDVDGFWVNDLEDGNMDFFQCHRCDIFFKVKLEVHKEYDYIITKPTKEEIKEYGLLFVEDFVEDCHGQTFIWKNLFSNES